MRYRTLLLFFALVSLLAAPRICAGAAPTAEEVTKQFLLPRLTGITKVWVLIMGPYDSTINVDTKALQDAIEVKLKNVGLEALTPSTFVKLTPILHVELETLRTPDRNVVYSLNMELTDDAKLDRNPAVFVPGMTWRQHTLGICSEREVDSVIRDAASKYTDAFLNYYLSANPKK